MMAQVQEGAAEASDGRRAVGGQEDVPDHHQHRAFPDMIVCDV